MIKTLLFIYQIIGVLGINYRTQAKRYAEEGNFIKAEQIYNEAICSDKEDMRIRKEYYEFLIKLGEYEKVLKMRDELNLSNERMENALKLLNIYNSKNKTLIANLTETSPYNFVILITAAEEALQSGKNDTSLQTYLSIIGELYPDNSRFLKLMAKIALKEDRFSAAIDHLEKAKDFETARIIRNFTAQIQKIENIFNRQEKENLLLNLFVNVQKVLARDSDEPNFYEPLLKTVLVKIIDFWIIHKAPNGVSYSARLLRIEPRNSSFILRHINLLIYDGRIAEAKRTFENFRRLYTQKDQKKIEIILENAERMAAEKEKEREDERKKEYSRRVKDNKTPQAGQDFLGYYKMVGVSSSATDAEIKKAWKRAVFRLRKKKGENSEKEEMDLNSAYEVLSNKKKRELYDNGINPDSPGAQYHQGNQQYQADDVDINDIFKKFFSAGSGEEGSHGFFKGFREFRSFGNGRNFTRRIIIER